MISRNNWLAWGVSAIIAASGCARAQAPFFLSHTDVDHVIGQALQAAAQAGVTSGFIAVSDREGYILGLYNISGIAPGPTNLGPVNAIDKAGTAAYLSSNAEAFTSRTAGFIIQPHFPPGVGNTGTGPLTGVGLSSLPFSDENHFRVPGANSALGIPNTSLSGNPGGVPLYKNNVLVGAVGVDTNTVLSALIFDGGPNPDEAIAIRAQTGFEPSDSILATNVLINGIRVPYTSVTGTVGSALPTIASHYRDPLTGAVSTPMDSPNMPFHPLQTNPYPFPDFPGGEIRDPIIDSPNLAVSKINGQLRLNKTEVAQILNQAASRASKTRGAIRNPIGPAEVFIVVVDYYGSLVLNDPGNKPAILGSFRTPDATIFSYDVACQKARTALFFSNNAIALSSRAVGFLAQGTYPPGIDGTTYGPYGPPTYGSSDPNFGVPGVPIFPLPFGIQTAVSVNPFGGPNNTAGGMPIPLTPINPYLPNGITVFPGGFPLYRNGVLIGAVGISGDGVDQDDIISASATVGFEAPTTIRSDQYAFRGARLPYAKFPQNSSL